MYAVSTHGLNSSSSSAQSAISAESSHLQAQRNKIKQFIKDNYNEIISNVEHIDEAEVVCFGENHYNDNHRRINGEMIDMLYVDEGILLIEKPTKEREGESNRLYDLAPNEQAKYVTKPIPTQGWDIEEDENLRKELYEYVNANMIYEEPRATLILSSSRVQQFANSLDNEHSSTFCQIATIFSFCCALCCVSLFCKILYSLCKKIL